MSLPAVFIERLERIIPSIDYPQVLASFTTPDVVAFRVNTLKTSVADLIHRLTVAGFIASPVKWDSKAFTLDHSCREKFISSPFFASGEVYIQSLSSMLPVLALSPDEGELVLDACAAPGSKTTQMSVMMGNTGTITAVEVVKNRFYKLRAVSALSGATNIEFKLTDVRRFRSCLGLYDKILVDAPCSSEGRFKNFDPASIGYWSLRKIKEMSHKQKGILLSASRFLKSGGELVYSTCTFAPEENEEVVDWFLRKTQGFELQPVMFETVATYPAIKTWNGRSYSHDLGLCFRALPDRAGITGFFIAKFRKSA